MQKMLRPSQRGARVEWRIFFLAIIILAGLGGLVAKLWWEQVARGPFWARKIAGRSQVTVRIPSVRGEIRDRNGITLVANRASYEVDFYLPDMVRGYKQEFGSVPTRNFKAPVRQMLKEKREADVVKIVNEKVFPRLDTLDLWVDYNEEQLRKHYRNDTEVPFTYREELDFKTLARFSEHDVGLPGVDIAIRPVRKYIYGSLAAHLLGYVGAPNDVDRLPDVGDYTFYQPDVEGKSQVELYLDKYIRGTPGVRVLQRSVKGQIEGEIRRVEPRQGASIYLTIDARIQYIAERALRVIGRGAAVVVNPKNGDILAMCSVPSYDPNWFIPSISQKDWKTINEDETDPLTNRAIQGYAPGSTYKTVSGLAGLRKGLTARSTFTCTGGVTYGTKFMKCWVVDKHLPPHGTLGLSDALKFSCNAFFYQWGNAAGIENIDAVGEALGLGQKSGVPLSGEDAGILPSPELLRQTNPNERWSNGYTANTSIGQGSVEASPLQMAMVTSTIANRGISYKPRLVHRVIDADGHDVRDENGKFVAPLDPEIRADLHATGISDEEIELLRRGMWKVVNEPGGTGKRAQVKGVEVAGKTGTAQFWRGNVKDNHTWFICFAPYQEPKYAICVMVQGAKSGGGVSAPIAQKILEESLALETGYDPGLAKLEPAVGSFAQIEAVDYKSKDAAVAKLAAQAGHEDEETADHVDGPMQKDRGRQIGATPDIRFAPDQAGRLQRGERPPPVDKRGFFERFFRSLGKPKPAPIDRRAPLTPFRPGGR